jgi:hypothetical protein
MSVTTPTLFHVDPSQTPWYDRFFSTWGFDTSDELFAAIDGVELPVDAVARSDDLARLGLSGWLYWTLYIKGYLQYLRGRDVGAENVYLDYLVRYGRGHNHDPGVADELASPETARARVERRFHDFDAFRRAARDGLQEETDILPISCRVLREPQRDTKPLVDSDSGEVIAASMLDGYHRVFLARLYGLRRLPCRVTDETDGDAGLQDVAGEVGL